MLRLVRYLSIINSTTTSAIGEGSSKHGKAQRESEGYIWLATKRPSVLFEFLYVKRLQFYVFVQGE